MADIDRQSYPDYSNMVRLDGRHVIVIGGGQGMGRQTCIALAALGARVSVVDVEENVAEAVAAEVSGQAIVGDATSAEGMRSILERAVAADGPIRGLVDIVGRSHWTPLREIDETTFATALQLNLMHAVHALQIAPEFIAPEGASFAFVSSISSIDSAPRHAAYGAAKAALNSLIATAAIELGPTIRVNGVAPGHIKTPRVMALQGRTSESYDAEGAKIPAGRVGETWDIASALLYLVSDLSAWVTGQVLVVDGGNRRKFPYVIDI